MEMDVENGLSCVLARIHYHPEAGFIYPFLLSKVGGYSQDVPHELFVVLIKFEYSGDMVLGDYEDMYRRFWIYIIERQHFIIFIDDIAGDLSPYNPTEDAIRFGFLHGFTLYVHLYRKTPEPFILIDINVFSEAYRPLFRLSMIAPKEEVHPRRLFVEAPVPRHKRIIDYILLFTVSF